MADAEKAEAPAGAPAPHDTDAIVNQWLAAYFPATLITRDSAGWQHILAAAEELKRRLRSPQTPQ